MPGHDDPLTFPLWTCIDTEGRQLVASDDDGNPDFPVWETMEKCCKEAPPRMIAVELDYQIFIERLKQFPGDSQISIYRANGLRYRYPLKKMLVAFLQAESPKEP